MIRLKLSTLVAIMAVAITSQISFGQANLQWFTDLDYIGTDALLYPSSGQPGQGDISFGLVSGAEDWYVMIYDADQLAIEDWNWTDYGTPEGARTAILDAELYGGQFIDIDQLNGGYETWIEQTGISGSAFSDKKLGTIAFNSADPVNADLGQLMFAPGTKTFEAPNMNDPQIPTQQYDLGVIGFDGSEWNAIPEPSSILVGLFGIFAMRAALQKRRKKNS